jgi:GMP synthase (glutamine-hydrolysing)
VLLIIDNQSSFIKRFKRTFLSEQDFDYVFFDHNQPIVLSAKSEVKGIILSGGKGNPYEPLNLTANYVAMMNFDVPVLGFCLGHEILAVAYGGRIRKLAEPQTKSIPVTVTQPDDPIFAGLNVEDLSFRRRHSFQVAELPRDFVSLAESTVTPNEIIRHRDKPLYGFQAHPEVSGHQGLQVVANFLGMCGLPVAA